MFNIDLVNRAVGRVSHIAEDGEDNTRAEDATVRTLIDKYWYKISYHIYSRDTWVRKICLPDMELQSMVQFHHFFRYVISIIIWWYGHLVAQLQMAMRTASRMQLWLNLVGAKYRQWWCWWHWWQRQDCEQGDGCWKLVVSLMTAKVLAASISCNMIIRK